MKTIEELMKIPYRLEVVSVSERLCKRFSHILP